MAVRTFVTAAVAFAAAGAAAATVALAPPLSPRDVRVAKSTEVSLNAVVADPALVQLIDAYFNSGVAAVVQQLLIDAVGPDPAAVDLINGFFGTGVSEVARQLLVAANPTNTDGNDFINVFFNGDNPLATPDEDGVSDNPALFGASGVVYQRLSLAHDAGDLTEDQWAVIDALFQGGLTQVTQDQLLAYFPAQQDLINDFFDGGVSQVVQTRLARSPRGSSSS